MTQEHRLLDQVRDCVRFRRYSIRTEQAYLGWICRFSFTETSSARHEGIGSREVSLRASVFARP